MQTVENKMSAGETITLDDKHFVNCKFERCTLFYSGGDFALTNTNLKDCPVTLTGPAQRTATLLRVLGALKAGTAFSGSPGSPSPQLQ
jgi:hypothetical protein